MPNTGPLYVDSFELDTFEEYIFSDFVHFLFSPNLFSVRSTRCLLAAGALVVSLAAQLPVLAQKVKSVPFAYLPEPSYDRYNQRLTQKTLPLDAGGFLILAHKAAAGYAVERYDSELKRQWSTELPLTAEENIEGFARSGQLATVVVYRRSGTAQTLAGCTIDLKTGQKSPLQKLVEVGSRDRRPGVSFSPDGTKTVAWQYLTRNQQIRAVAASVYDARLTKLKDRTYDFHDQGAFFSTTINVDNDGTQYVTLLGDGMKKLTVRRYQNDNPAVKVMSVAVGGMFGGREVMVFDAKFSLQPDHTLYAAAVCTERETGLYHSLKVVKFDFADGDLKLAPEVLFKPRLPGRSKSAYSGQSHAPGRYLLSSVATQ